VPAQQEQPGAVGGELSDALATVGIDVRVLDCCEHARSEGGRA
jgi:hypothetical protein